MVCMQCQRTGFSLIELLAVIAIISVLAAMLLPTLEKSLASARTVACRNQFRQIGVGVALYADSHADYIPHGYHRKGPVGNETAYPIDWYASLRPYCGSAFGNHATLQHRGVPGNLAMCPDYDGTSYTAVNTGMEPSRCQYWILTTCNPNFYFRYGKDGAYGATRLAQIRKPSLAMLSIESANNKTHVWYDLYYNPRHFGLLYGTPPHAGMNAAFKNGIGSAALSVNADGHVAEQAFILSRINWPPLPDTPANNAIWCNDMVP